jgi:diguanylate cyclase (GGDEF)-like protein/PAS domain S-box-containing protein
VGCDIEAHATRQSSGNAQPMEETFGLVPSFTLYTPVLVLRSYKSNLLVSLLLALTAIGMALIASIWWHQQQRMDDQARERLRLAQTLFRERLAERGRTMATALSFVRRNERLAQALQAGDRDGLLILSKDLFEPLQTGQADELHFYDPAGKDILQVRNPDLPGEVIARLGRQRVEKRVELSSEVGSGSLGVPMIRTVTPWTERGQLIGYVELAEEIGPLIAGLETASHAEWLVFIDKRRLSREQWEAGVRKSLIQAYPWERFTDTVLLGARRDSLVNALGSRLDGLEGGGMKGVKANNRRYVGGFIDLKDVAQGRLGKLLVLHDMTSAHRDDQKILWIAGSVGVGIAALGLGFAFVVVSRNERRLETVRKELLDSKNHLELEVARRTHATSNVNVDLQREVNDREQAEQRLLRNQLFLLTILDSLAYPFFVVDARDFSIKLANKAALNGGVSPNGIKNCYTLMYGFDQPCMGKDTPCVLKDIYRRKQPVMVEHRLYDSEGQPVVYDVHAYPVFNAKGQIEQIIEYFIDVTERKRAEEALRDSEHNYRELVETANSIVLRRDTRGVIKFINGFGQRFFGFDEGELVGKPVIGTIVPERDSNGVDLVAMIEKISSDPDKFQSNENENMRKDGARVWIAWANKAICDKDGTVVEILSFGNDITQRRRAINALAESEARFRNIYDNSPVMMHSIDEEGRLVSVNRKWEEETGYAREEVVGQTLDFLMTPESSEKAISQMFPLFRTQGYVRDTAYQFIKKDGEIIDVSMSCNLSLDPDGRRISLSVVENISERRRAERELLLAASVFESSIEGILITDSEERILRTNKAFTVMTGYTAEDVKGMRPSFLASGRHDVMFYQNMWKALKENGFWQGEVWNRRKDGEIYPEWLSISTVYNEKHQPAYYVGVFTDITDQKLSENRIYHLAHYDALTDLPNRVLFQDRLDHALVEARRGGYSVPILYLDLDRFKPINDSFGHPVGDLLLQQVAERLRRCVREADTVARMGGDEFTVILGQNASGGASDIVQMGSRVAHAILDALAQPFNLEGHEVFISASIGIVVYPQDGMSVAQLIKNADTAMYHAKDKGRNNYLFYEPHMNAAAADRLLIENSLRRALERGEFELYYQPSINIREGRIDALEALIRWRHPELGMIPPDRFVPLAEESGLIVPIGEWVLREAIRQVGLWRQAGFNTVRVAVNLSLRQFRHRDLINVIKQAVDDEGMAPSALALEVTESVFMEDEEETIARLNEMSRMGIEILIDDFGTGYSSLARLRMLPIHVLKVDRSFVRDITTDPNDASIIAAIISMAHNLQLKVIAEGVETVNQLNFLKAQGCDDIQGYLLSQPIPAMEVIPFLKKGVALPVEAVCLKSV